MSICLSAVRCCCRLHAYSLSHLFSLWEQCSSLHSLCLIVPTRSSDPSSSHTTLLFSIFPPPYLLSLLWKKEGTENEHIQNGNRSCAARSGTVRTNPHHISVFSKHAPPHASSTPLLSFPILNVQDVTISFPVCRTTYHHDDLRQILFFATIVRTNRYKTPQNDLHPTLFHQKNISFTNTLPRRHLI
ncbi:hypothetical protein EDB89DRAFT_1631770 [Lactarius sanguifluus]|nr:hypothetical protein EDB89DRAFT_1631770 [Lactarius sanguifluus]